MMDIGGGAKGGHMSGGKGDARADIDLVGCRKI